VRPERKELGMLIEILGTGCPKCAKLAEAAQEAVDDLGLDAEVVKVTEITELMKRGVMMTPAVAVDGELKSSGKLLTVDKLRELFATGV